jgi:hypothetical protein
MNKEEAARELRSMVEESLFGGGPWSSNDLEVNRAIGEKLSALGLEHVDPVTGAIHTTDLGQKLDVDTMSVFMGYHEPFEAPHRLVGFITGAEADELAARFENGERPEEVLPPLLRRLWNKHFAH